MTGLKSDLLKVTLFAIAFAFVEAAVVIYLRHLLSAFHPSVLKEQVLVLLPGIAFLEPKTALQIISNSSILTVERFREAATLIMLFAVAWLVAKKWEQLIAFFFFTFSIWDIFYYVFLRLTIGWPSSFLDLDVFFLLPVPWVGPVFVPILISIVLIVGSGLYLRKSFR